MKGEKINHVTLPQSAPLAFWYLVIAKIRSSYLQLVTVQTAIYILLWRNYCRANLQS